MNKFQSIRGGSASREENSDRDAKRRSRDIDNKLKKEQLKQKSEESETVKIMLLGSGDSGKSTVLKQLQILHGGGFTEKETSRFREGVINNVLDSMKALSYNAYMMKIPIDKENEEIARKLKEGIALEDLELLPESLAISINNLWKDEGIQTCYKRANEFTIQDTAEYVLNKVMSFSDPNYSLTTEDILKIRFRTTSISETTFMIKRLKHIIYDVGGQKSLRNFWTPFFADGLAAIIYVSSLAAYDQYVDEDRTNNRMSDSMDLFKSIMNNSKLKKTSIILFLNKLDLFERKIKSGQSPLEKYFPDYQPTSTPFESGQNFFEGLFNQMNPFPERKLFVKFTNSTDSTLMEVVIDTVTEIVLESQLKESGVI